MHRMQRFFTLFLLFMLFKIGMMFIGKTKCFVHAAVSDHKKVNTIEFPESHNKVHMCRNRR